MTWSVLATTLLFAVLEALGVALIVGSVVHHNGQELYMGLVVAFFVPLLAALTINPLSKLLPAGVQTVIVVMCGVAEVFVGISFVVYARNMRQRRE